jgi:hypothetical protein
MLCKGGCWGMYYSNKLGFYIKQYTFQIVVGMICLVIISSGLFLYFKINHKTQQATTVVSGTVETNEETNTDLNVTEDESILQEDLKTLKSGQKAKVKVATIDDKGVLVLISGDTRIKAKMIGIEFSNDLPDTLYNIDQDLSGKYVEIAFDESKISAGYAMVYIYTEDNSLYNAKLLKEGKLKLDSSVSKKALEYNKLAESQAFAKQTLAGVWGN